MQDCGVQEWDSYDRVFQRPRQAEDWSHHREPGEELGLEVICQTFTAGEMACC